MISWVRIFDVNELDYDSETILRREISPSGKSRAFINDSPVTVSLLQNIGSALIEIHGQNEKIGLLDPGLHVKLLDRYARHSSLLKRLEFTISLELHINFEKATTTTITTTRNKHVPIDNQNENNKQNNFGMR